MNKIKIELTQEQIETIINSLKFTDSEFGCYFEDSKEMKLCKCFEDMLRNNN